MTNKDKWNNNYPHARIDDKHPFFPVSWKYQPPVRGGSFHVNAVMAVKHPFFFEFTEVKLKTAYIARHLHSFLIKQKIATNAGQNEMDHCTFARLAYHTNQLSSQCTHPNLTKREHILLEVMMCNKFTIVTHPVGFHCDTFGGGQESYENKATFKIEQCHRSIGRGGNGKHFTFALLDWTSTNIGSRRRAYLQGGGNAEQIVGAGFWREWLVADNHNNLRRMVGEVPEMRGHEIIPEDLRAMSQEM